MISPTPHTSYNLMVSLICSDNKSCAAAYLRQDISNIERKEAVTALKDYHLKGAEGSSPVWVSKLLYAHATDDMYIATNLEKKDAEWLLGFKINEYTSNDLGYKYSLCDPHDSYLLHGISTCIEKLGEKYHHSEIDDSRHLYLKGLVVTDQWVSLEYGNFEYWRNLTFMFNIIAGWHENEDPCKARQWYLLGLHGAKRLLSLDLNNTDSLQILYQTYKCIWCLDGRLAPDNPKECQSNMQYIIQKISESKPCYPVFRPEFDC